MIGASDRPIRASGATPIDDQEFQEKFTAVIGTPEAEQLTTTGTGCSAKASGTQINRPVKGKLPIICEDCGPGEQAVPLGCRGPRPTTSPQA